MRPPEPLTSYRDLFEHVFAQIVAQDLEGWIKDRIDEDRDVSWRELERRIDDETDGLLPVSHVTLSSWFSDMRNNYTPKAAA